MSEQDGHILLFWL